MESTLMEKSNAHEAVEERIAFRGHPMVRSLHPTTVEITTEGSLTPKGDCIVGVSAERGCAGLSEKVKAGLRRSSAKVRIRFTVDDLTFDLEARGDPRLELSDPHDIVVRKSGFISDRTVAVFATASAKDLPSSMVSRLQSEDATGVMEVRVT